MPISLNKVNAEAYAKVAAALEQNGKAAVEHATGTGKSCIAWQLIADHPQASFIWLVYGAARLTLRREDVRRYNDGMLPENLIFCDCGVLAEASAEEWVRLASRKPDYLIFDCYHDGGLLGQIDPAAAPPVPGGKAAGPDSAQQHRPEMPGGRGTLRGDGRLPDDGRRGNGAGHPAGAVELRRDALAAGRADEPAPCPDQEPAPARADQRAERTIR